MISPTNLELLGLNTRLGFNRSGWINVAVRVAGEHFLLGLSLKPHGSKASEASYFRQSSGAKAHHLHCTFVPTAAARRRGLEICVDMGISDNALLVGALRNKNYYDFFIALH